MNSVQQRASGKFMRDIHYWGVAPPSLFFWIVMAFVGRPLGVIVHLSGTGICVPATWAPAWAFVYSAGINVQNEKRTRGMSCFGCDTVYAGRKLQVCRRNKQLPFTEKNLYMKYNCTPSYRSWSFHTEDGQFIQHYIPEANYFYRGVAGNREDLLLQHIRISYLHRLLSVYSRVKWRHIMLNTVICHFVTPYKDCLAVDDKGSQLQ